MNNAIRKTAYYREFMDFGYLWMLRSGHNVPVTYRPLDRNISLWNQLTAQLPPQFFNCCPMHMLGEILQRPPRAKRQVPFVLTVSLNPGLAQNIQAQENRAGLYNNFGNNGADYADGCSNYFQIIYGDGGLNIVGNGFWRKLSRMTYRAMNGVNIVNGQILDWMSASVVHTDLWPLRVGNFGDFIAHENGFPPGFARPTRNAMLIDFIQAADADVTLLLGNEIDLGFGIGNLQALPLLGNLQAPTVERPVFRVPNLPRCYRTIHPSAIGVRNAEFDNIGERIFIDLN